jgi:hypothetical protein
MDFGRFDEEIIFRSSMANSGAVPRIGHKQRPLERKLESRFISPGRSKVSVQTTGVSGAHRLHSRSRHGRRKQAGRRLGVTSQGSAAQRKGEFAGRSGLNRVNVTGRLGRDAVVRQTKNGRVANFLVAVDESYKDRLGEWHTKTEWHRVQVWEELAETVGADLGKGVRVHVEGRRTIRH